MKVSIRNRNSLALVIQTDEQQSPHGCAFVMHGLGGFKEQKHIEQVAQLFHEAGLTVVRFDATNSFGESGGRYEDATFQQYYEDLEDVIAWARSQQWFQTPFILAGHSLGGHCVTRYAEEHPKDVRALASLAPVISGNTLINSLEKNQTDRFNEWRKTGWSVEESLSKPGVMKRLPWSFIEESKNHDVLPEAAVLTMPVLIIVGEQDTSTPPDYARKFYDALPGKKEIEIIPNAPHTFRDDAHLAESERILRAWIPSIF